MGDEEVREKERRNLFLTNRNQNIIYSRPPVDYRQEKASAPAVLVRPVTKLSITAHRYQLEEAR